MTTPEILPIEIGKLYRLMLCQNGTACSWMHPNGTILCNSDDFIMPIAAKYQEDIDPSLPEGVMNPKAWIEIKFLSPRSEKIETITVRLIEWEDLFAREL